MERIAVIIRGFANSPSDKEKQDECISNYELFLKSNMGGAWEDHQIFIRLEPSLDDLKELISEKNYDYVLIIMLGHGATQDSKQLFQINEREIIQAGNLVLDAPKQLIILDTCRNLIKNIPFIKIQDRIPIFDKGGKYPISREEAQQLFNQSLADCKDGLVVCYACSLGEAAYEYYFSKSLLKNAFNWHEQYKSGVLSITDLMKEVYIEVQNISPKQNPEIIGNIPFPFVVNKFNTLSWKSIEKDKNLLAIEQKICIALAQETWENMITAGKKYTVILQKDEDFPDGEECVLGDNGELITLYFKHQILFESHGNNL